MFTNLIQHANSDEDDEKEEEEEEEEEDLKVYMEVGCQKSKIKTTDSHEIMSWDYGIEEPH